MTIGPVNSQQAYLPPEQDFPEDQLLFREILANRERLTATCVNIKENGQYEQTEILTGQQWFNSTNSTTGQNNIKRYSYRTTFDLVALHGGPIPLGITTLNLSNSTIPPLIKFADSLLPLNGKGAATASNGNFYFINDPSLSVITTSMTPTTQTIVINNSTGSTLTWCVWVFEYLKT